VVSRRAELGSLRTWNCLWSTRTRFWNRCSISRSRRLTSNQGRNW